MTALSGRLPLRLPFGASAAALAWPVRPAWRVSRARSSSRRRAVPFIRGGRTARWSARPQGRHALVPGPRRRNAGRLRAHDRPAGAARRGRGRILAGLGLLVSLTLFAFAGPHLTGRSWTAVDLGAFREPPSAAHWLGTTQTGRDMYAITLHGLRTSLVTGLLVALSATGLATIAGAAAGYFGRRLGRCLTCAVDVLLALPPLLAVATVSPALHAADPLVLAPLLAAFMWMVTARAVRSMTVSLRETEYVLAARYAGVAPTAIIFRHVVPHLASVLIVDATLNVSTAIIGETSLSYLGLGVRPPDVSLGTIIADGAPSAAVFPWLFLPPVVLLILVVLSVNLTGDGLRDALDPGR